MSLIGLVLSLSVVYSFSVAAVTEPFAYPDGLLEGNGAVGDWTGPWVAGGESEPPLGSAPFQVESERLKVDFSFCIL